MADTLTFEEFKSSGITSKTPKNIVFGAGTIHKGLKYDASKKAWNFAESLIGATSGGTKLSIKPELKDIEVDGELVKVKELTVKHRWIQTWWSCRLRRSKWLLSDRMAHQQRKDTM